MSMKKLALFNTRNNNGELNYTETQNLMPGSPSVPVHGINVMLGGAMLSGIILVIFIMCYCCHKGNRKTPTSMQPYWRNPELSMDIYTVETQNYQDTEDLTSTEVRAPTNLGPPPPYELVAPLIKSSENNKQISEEAELPSYETAVKLHVIDHGHI